jgi:hypothetical protein
MTVAERNRKVGLPTHPTLPPHTHPPLPVIDLTISDSESGDACANSDADAEFEEEPNLDQETLFCFPDTKLIKFTSVTGVSNLNNWYDLLRAERDRVVSFYFAKRTAEERKNLCSSIQRFWCGELTETYAESYENGVDSFWNDAILDNTISSLMAEFLKRLRSIVASEAECERAFSSIRKDLDDQRHALSRESEFSNLVLSYHETVTESAPKTVPGRSLKVKK